MPKKETSPKKDQELGLYQARILKAVPVRGSIGLRALAERTQSLSDWSSFHHAVEWMIVNGYLTKDSSGRISRKY